MRTSELEAKEIININTGQRLGVVMDVDVNLSGGQIKGLVVPKENKMFSFLGLVRRSIFRGLKYIK